MPTQPSKSVAMSSQAVKSEKSKPIPYGLHWIGEDEIEQVLDTLKNGYLTSGPKVDLFENEVKKYVSAKFTVATSSCTSAMHLALLGAGIGPGDEVITTVMTYVATVNSVLYTGATPVFVDIDPKTFNIDPNSIERKITPKTKAILVVHYAGQPCQIDAIRQIAKKHKLTVIEDASHAIGASFQDVKVGHEGTACFSFHPVKNMTSAEGGMIATDSESVARMAKALRLHGFAEDYRQREKKDMFVYPQMEYLGFKYNMSDIQAAIGLCQLKKLDSFIQRRREIANFYNQSLKRDELILPHCLPQADHAWHLYVIRLNTQKVKALRDLVMKELSNRGITTSVHYLPVHLHQYYRKRFKTKEGDYPQAEAAYESIITIPLFAKMSDDDSKRVVAAIHEVLDQFSRS